LTIEVDIVLLEKGHRLGSILGNLLDLIILNRAAVAAGSAITVFEELEFIRDERTTLDVTQGYRTG
jgi:hypothetical protein